MDEAELKIMHDGCLIIIFIDDGDEDRFGLLTLCWKWTSVATGLA